MFKILATAFSAFIVGSAVGSVIVYLSIKTVICSI